MSPRKKYLAGLAGGAAGTAAMGLYMKLASKLGAPNPMQPPEGQKHDMSLVGRQHREDEPATMALGRIVYQKVADKEPPEATRNKLSRAIHWIYGTEMGGLYGLVRGPAGTVDLVGGAAFGAALWALGDGIGVPLLGLAEGPKAFPVSVHAETLGAHVAYGIVAAATTQLVERVL